VGNKPFARRHDKMKTNSNAKLLQVDSTSPKSLGWRMPAEWEPHAATWLAFPHKQGDWPGKADSIIWVFAEIAKQLTRAERVRLLVRNSSDAARAHNVFARAGANFEQVDCVKCDTNRSWTRDYLPSFLVHGQRGARQRSHSLVAVKWQFKGWNRYPDHQLDNEAGHFVAEHYAEHAFFPQASVRGRLSRVVLEGGSIDVDGEGTLLTTEECLLTGPRARHKSLGRQASEKILGDYFGIDRVIWLQNGIAGDDTSGHIDDFARFVRPGTIVLCSEKRKSDPNSRVLAQAHERLKAARDAKNRRLEVIPLPMPEPVMDRRTRLPASYANFYIGSECVLVPTFNDVQDRNALGILSELFPNRRVVGIHATDLLLGLGTLHCSTQQEPKP
jgi:agmatine deiminase